MDNRLLLTAVLFTLTACAGGSGETPDPLPETPTPPADVVDTKQVDAPPTTPPPVTPDRPADHECFAKDMRGVVDTPKPLTNAGDLAGLLKTYTNAGGSANDCDPAKALGQAAAMCFADHASPELLKLQVSTEFGHSDFAQPPRLVWQIGDEGCGRRVTIDATNGNELATSHCMKGRPCSIGNGKRRARLVRSRAWS